MAHRKQAQGDKAEGSEGNAQGHIHFTSASQRSQCRMLGPHPHAYIRQISSYKGPSGIQYVGVHLRRLPHARLGQGSAWPGQPRTFFRPRFLAVLVTLPIFNHFCIWRRHVKAPDRLSTVSFSDLSLSDIWQSYTLYA